MGKCVLQLQGAVQSGQNVRNLNKTRSALALWSLKEAKDKGLNFYDLGSVQKIQTRKIPGKVGPPCIPSEEPNGRFGRRAEAYGRWSRTGAVLRWAATVWRGLWWRLYTDTMRDTTFLERVFSFLEVSGSACFFLRGGGFFSPDTCAADVAP